MRAKPNFVICVANKGYPASLELRKIYRVFPDKAAARLHQIRVIDESGEDYLYPEDCFILDEVSNWESSETLVTWAPLASLYIGR